MKSMQFFFSQNNNQQYLTNSLKGRHNSHSDRCRETVLNSIYKTSIKHKNSKTKWKISS